MQLSCPTAGRLREFLEGSVGDAEASQISEHVVECPNCDRVLCTLESEQGDVLKTLREGIRTESLLQEPEFEQLRNTARFSQADTTAVSDVDEHPETGKRLRDYRLVKKIGEGGMGTVYQAFHVHLAKHVALKILPSDKLRSKQSVARFRQEMRAVGQVNHPNVVSASDAGTIDGQHFLVMELVQGADLARIIHDRGPLNVADACEIVRQAAIGLQHAHDNGLVHRDVKPSNVMLAIDGSVKLLDLGLAGLNNSEFESTANVVVTDRLTSVGQIMGTLDYMAPEQITASPQVDGKADIYALGATLFQLLTGRTPCGDRSEGTPERIQAVLHNPPLDIATLRNDVPEELCALLLKMLAKNPDDRPQAAIDVAGELERFASDADLVALAEACRTSLDMPSADVDVTDDVSFVVSRTAQSQDEVNSRRPLTAVALASFFLALVAAVVYYIQTDNGVVRVEVTDPSLKVAISDQTITMKEGNKKPLTIRAGEQSLVVREGDSDFEFETDRFQIRRGDKIAFKVELLAGKVVVSKDGEKIGSKTLANNRDLPPAKPDMLSRRPDNQETTKDELRKILERSPHSREKLAQDAEESGNLELAKWIRSDLPVDDGQDSLALANSLAEKDDWAAATDAYLSAYRSDPNLYVGRHVQAFQKAGRLTELARFFDETRLQKLDPFNNGMESLIWALLRKQETQPAGYELLKRVFNYKSYTADLLLRQSNFPWEKVPDPVFYLRRVLLPHDFEKPGWSRLSVGSSAADRVSVSGSLTLMQPLYHNREALQEFAGEIRQLLEQHPKWVAGWALLAFIEAESGNSREAVDVLRKRFLDANSDEIPTSAAWLLGECLKGKDEELDRVVIELLEPCVRQIATLTYRRTPRTYGPIGGTSLRVSPIKTLARLYAKYDRRQEARQLLFGLTYSTNQHPLVEGYKGSAIASCGRVRQCSACHRDDRGHPKIRSYFDFIEMSDAMTDIGYPVDSILALAQMDRSYRNAFASPRGWIDSRSAFGADMEKFDLLYKGFSETFDRQKSKAEKVVTPRLVVEALEMDTFQRSLRFDENSLSAALELMKSVEGDDEKNKVLRELARTSQERENKEKVVLDLMLSVRGEGPDAKATVFSPVVDILKLAVESKQTGAAKDIAELDARLVTLSEQHPTSVEAGIVATVFAFLRDDLDSAKDRMKRLYAITDYPESDGAAFWLVARHAVQHDQTRIIGAVLAERALTAAETQPDSRLKEAILGERSGEDLRKVLKRDPHLREKLAQQAEERGNSELAEWIRSDLPEDDGQDSLALATRLAETEEWMAATDAYLAAYQANPDTFNKEHIAVFQKAGQMAKLAKCFDEAAFRKMGYFNDSTYLLDAILGDPKTRSLGYEVLKALFKGKPSKQHALLSNPAYYSFTWDEVPDPIFFLRTVFVPTDFEKEGAGWHRLGMLNEMQPLYYDRNVLQQLAEEVRTLVHQNESWDGGKVLLAFLDAEIGNYPRAAASLQDLLLESNEKPIPIHLASELAHALDGKDEKINQCVITLYERSLRNYVSQTIPSLGGTYTDPRLRDQGIEDLAKLYAKYGRRLEARQLLYGLVDTEDQHPLVAGYVPGSVGRCYYQGRCTACHRKETNLFDYTVMSDAMTDIGYPVDSLVALARVDASFRNAFGSPRGWIDTSSEAGIALDKFASKDTKFKKQQAKAEKAVTPRLVIEALGRDTFQRSARIDEVRLSTALELMKSIEGGDEKTKALRELARTSQQQENNKTARIDLMVSVRGEGPDAQATVFSPVIDILKLAVESKGTDAAKDIAELDARLVHLSEQHPESIEAGIVATVFAFLRNDLDSAKDRLKRLQAITDYPESDGAAFWLVARHALKYEQTRIIGAVLAERALNAAETQPDSGLKEAILRERSGKNFR